MASCVRPLSESNFRDSSSDDFHQTSNPLAAIYDIAFSFQLMTGISWMLQEAGDCPAEDYIVYDDHEEEGSGDLESMEYEYSYDVKSDKAPGVTDSNSSLVVTQHVTTQF